MDFLLRVGIELEGHGCCWVRLLAGLIAFAFVIGPVTTAIADDFHGDDGRHFLGSGLLRLLLGIGLSRCRGGCSGAGSSAG